MSAYVVGPHHLVVTLISCAPALRRLRNECLARRHFFELADIAAQARQRKGAASISPMALEAVQRIDRIFEVERGIYGKSADERRDVRADIVTPLVTDLEVWMRDNRAKLSRHDPVAKAMDYMLKDRTAFTAFLTDGRIWL